MINFFLRAKHWQLFLLIFGVPLAFYGVMVYAMMSTVFSVISTNGESSDAEIMEGMAQYFQLLPVIVILFMGALYGWYWSIVLGLQPRLPEGVRMNVRLFKIFLLIPLIYTVSVTIAVSFMIKGMFLGNPEENFEMFGYVFGIVFPLHLFSMFCSFYTLYFVAKTIKTVELQREANFGDFVGEFFLIWFYPIGVWILQPKINQLAEGNFGNSGYTGTKGSTILDERINH